MKRAFLRAVSILGLVGLLTAPAAFAQNTPFTLPQYYATNYNQWQIVGQSANTYLFSPGGLCNATASGAQFYVFNTNAPVLIVDATPANTEVVTSSTVTNTGSQCGFTASPANNHYSFRIQSGTGGLQEALNALSNGPSTTYPGLLIIDRNWYNAANVIPGTTPAAIIAAVTGTSATIILDNTTAPATYYVWGGSSYAPISLTPGTLFNKGVTSFTAIAAPTAVSTAAPTNGLLTTGTTGGTIPATSTYRMGLTYVDAAGGESTMSIDTASTATLATGSGSTNTLVVTSPAAATGAVGYRVYLTAASGSTKTEILYSPTCTHTSAQTVLPSATVCAIGATATLKAIVTGTATIPAVASAYPRTAGSSGSFPPVAAGGTIATTATGTLGIVNFPAGYFNTLGKSLYVCGTFAVTTNATPGTISLKAVLSSIYGVTSITPFTAVSGTTTGSAIVQAPFCFTMTTAATGATGTLWVHGWANFDLAGNGVGVEAQDFIYAVSSTVDLTKADTLSLTFTPTTTGSTAFQLTQLNAYPSN